MKDIAYVPKTYLLAFKRCKREYTVTNLRFVWNTSFKIINFSWSYLILILQYECITYLKY